jgi:Uma2 family endonuclease
VPDVTVLRRSDPVESIVRTPPLLCIEVLSPEDRLQRLQERVNDYFHMGVQHVWLIDPLTRNAWVATPDGSHMHAAEAFAILGTPIQIILADVFRELDERLTRA